jgi:lipopolysaccharide transport system ATP-binding protein
MEKDVILKVENLSKQYRLGLVGTGTLGHDLNRWWHRIRGKEDPYLKIGESNDRSTKGASEYVWALKDINFEVERGEVLGIIGKNGAGKSTLLKILSRVTAPTMGEIKTKGRIASLLEVGTGFHPEMTGKENVFLNGAILGMSKKEIQSKLNEIIEFSGCERYIDTPVKRYSSGMTVRLAFAVAAHLDPDILVIDEVLAVGDAEFQKKAIGKMQDISNSEGRTVLFVSHNMAAVKNLCTRAIVLQHGTKVFEGDTYDAVDFYLKNDMSNNTAKYINEISDEESDILEISVLNSKSELCSVFAFDDTIRLKVRFKVSQEKLNHNPIIGLKIIDQQERSVFTTQKYLSELNIDNNQNNSVIIELPNSFLVPSNYSINLGFHIKNREQITALKKIVSFTVEETGTDFSSYSSKDYGCVIVDCNWSKNS